MGYIRNKIWERKSREMISSCNGDINKILLRLKQYIDMWDSKYRNAFHISLYDFFDMSVPVPSIKPFQEEILKSRNVEALTELAKHSYTDVNKDKIEELLLEIASIEQLVTYSDDVLFRDFHRNNYGDTSIYDKIEKRLNESKDIEQLFKYFKKLLINPVYDVRRDKIESNVIEKIIYSGNAKYIYLTLANLGYVDSNYEQALFDTKDIKYISYYLLYISDARLNEFFKDHSDFIKFIIERKDLFDDDEAYLHAIKRAKGLLFNENEKLIKQATSGMKQELEESFESFIEGVTTDANVLKSVVKEKKK